MLNSPAVLPQPTAPVQAQLTKRTRRGTVHTTRKPREVQEIHPGGVQRDVNRAATAYEVPNSTEEYETISGSSKRVRQSTEPSVAMTALKRARADVDYGQEEADDERCR